MTKLKKSIVTLMLAGGFILSIGAFSNAQAQDGRWNRSRRVEQNRRDRDRDGIPDRYETRRGQPDFNRNGIPDRVERNRGYNRNGGYYGNDGYYGNRGYGNGNYGYNNSEFQKGYHDGLNRGREDSQSNRAMTPNNSSHYRSGNQTYRAGFERGFFEAYRQYSGRRW